jgi:hypothetical protein
LRFAFSGALASPRARTARSIGYIVGICASATALSGRDARQGVFPLVGSRVKTNLQTLRFLAEVGIATKRNVVAGPNADRHDGDSVGGAGVLRVWVCGDV